MSYGRSSGDPPVAYGIDTPIAFPRERNTLSPLPDGRNEGLLSSAGGDQTGLVRLACVHSQRMREINFATAGLSVRLTAMYGVNRSSADQPLALTMIDTLHVRLSGAVLPVNTACSAFVFLNATGIEDRIITTFSGKPSSILPKPIR